MPIRVGTPGSACNRRQLSKYIQNEQYLQIQAYPLLGKTENLAGTIFGDPVVMRIPS